MNVPVSATHMCHCKRPLTAAGARLLAAALFLFMMPGCNYVVLLGYLIGGPPSIEPDFDATVRQSMTDHGVTVAVVCYAPTELKWDFASIDQEIAGYVSHRLTQHHIHVLNPTRVQAWLDQNPDWDRPDEIGAALNVTYVVYIDVHKYTLYEENSQNLYRGQAEAIVSVFKMDDEGNGDRIYSKEIVSRYPLRAPRSTSEVTYARFKREYLTRLSEEIGRLFYEYYNGDDIPDAI